jgi:patatin-like phospholipase/acyl hydrolase
MVLRFFAKPSIIRKVTGGFFRSQYENKALLKALAKVFGDMKLKDLEHKVLIPTFDLDYNGFFRSWKPKFFTNFDPIDGEEYVTDVAMRTSAAPTYFPTYQGYVDGGLVANNPSMTALAQALNEGARLEDISILSISTGRTHHYISGTSLDWGLSRWLTHIVTMLFEGMVDIADYQCQRILRERYIRIDTMLRRNIDLDDASGLAEMVKVADELPLDDAEDFMYDYKFYLGVTK